MHTYFVFVLHFKSVTCICSIRALVDIAFCTSLFFKILYILSRGLHRTSPLLIGEGVRSTYTLPPQIMLPSLLFKGNSNLLTSLPLASLILYLFSCFHMYIYACKYNSI